MTYYCKSIPKSDNRLQGTRTHEGRPVFDIDHINEFRRSIPEASHGLMSRMASPTIMVLIGPQTTGVTRHGARPRSY
ncbi:MAG: hypothetical protein QNL05_04190 [Gammaproteobacteria bacterium]|nr:hypothetical protein [Gammaproteobacteria bacterium]